MSTPRGDPDGPDTRPGAGLWGGLWQRLVRSPAAHPAFGDGSGTAPGVAEEAGAYSREALQAMIERKRYNDAVRQREFDMLRKLRRRGMRPDPGGAQSPLFHSSIPSRPQERATTLKKIDEIEAQMSIQWRRVRAHAPLRPALPGAAPAPAPEILADAASVRLEPAGILNAPPNTLLRAAKARPAGITLAPLASTALGPASVPAAVAIDPGGVLEAPEPEIEEAALRFASGDVAGAQALLEALLAPGHPRSERPPAWELLFDLYRATGQQAAYDELATAFACRFQRSPPQWRCLWEAPAADAPAPPSPALRQEAGEEGAPRFDWICPPVLDALAVHQLARLLAPRPQPWHLSWSELAAVEPEALAVLAQRVAQWTREPVRLRVAGLDRLERLLDRHTACGDRQADPRWWALRMDWLRAMRRSDEFELVALDYCVTYEVSPPAWEAPRCEVRAIHAEPGARGDTVFDARDSRMSALGGGEPALSSRWGGSVFHASPVGELAGILQGDLAVELARLDARLGLHAQDGADPLVVSCARLVRIDFEAAGALLNWVAARQAEGRTVHLSEVHRLVAVFFTAMGLASQARITLARD